MTEKNETKSLPNLVGTNFVKNFREFLLSLINENKLTENDVVKKAYLEKNVKPETTRKYLGEMIELGILKKENEILEVML